ncbi:hypothetical protein [Streptomyces sp. NPDC088246]
MTETAPATTPAGRPWRTLIGRARPLLARAHRTSGETGVEIAPEE